jgi:hypothetical protein
MNEMDRRPINKLVNFTRYICWHDPKLCVVRFQSKLAAITITSGSCINHSWSQSGEQRQRQRLLVELMLVLLVLVPSPPSQNPSALRCAEPHFGSGSYFPRLTYCTVRTRMPIGSSRPRARISKDDDVAA